MLHVSELQRIYDYNYWANDRMLSVVEQLTPDEFCQSLAGSYGSIRNTLVHTLSAEWGWMDRCGGPPRGTSTCCFSMRRTDDHLEYY
jgi:uncharacterized damage-inducible protein DinB